MPDLLLAGIRPLVEEADDGHDEPRSAIAALEAVLLVERFLDGVHRPVCGQAFDRCDFVAVYLDAEQRAGLHRLAVQQHRAGAATGRVTADVRTGQAEPLAQDVNEQLARLELEDVLHPVDRDRDLTHGKLLSARESEREHTPCPEEDVEEPSTSWIGDSPPKLVDLVDPLSLPGLHVTFGARVSSRSSTKRRWL